MGSCAGVGAVHWWRCDVLVGPLMPTYVWYCKDCTAHLEKLVPIADRDNLVTCPECDHEMTRTVEAPAVMGVAMADGTRRFDPLRKVRAIDKELKNEKDKKRKAKLKEEQRRISKEAG